MNSKDIQVAPFTRRATAHLLDLAIWVVALTAIGFQLPVAPPPVDAMSFYTAQDFRNYFTLAGIGIVLALVMFLGLIFGWVKTTPGMWLTRLEYSGLDGSVPTLTSFRKRLLRGVLYTVLILFPGPILAFVVAAISANVLRVPFTSGADMLDKLGFPPLAQLAIHSLSFVALFVGLVYVHQQLSHGTRDSKLARVSWFDRKCGSTIVLKQNR